MFLPTLLVTTLLCCANAERNLTAEAQAFVSKYRELNYTVHYSMHLGSLERIGANSREMFRLGRPIGHLLSSFNSTGKATEDEESALAVLHGLFDHSYTQYRATNSTGFVINPGPFGLMLDKNREYIANLTNATVRAADHDELSHVKEMRLHNQHTWIMFNPLAVLDEIDTHSRLVCQLPTKEGIRLVGRLQDALWRVELAARGRWSQSDVTTFDEYRTGLLYLILRENEEAAEQLIERLDKLSTPTVNDVIKVIRSSHIKFIADYTPMMGINDCMLEFAMDKNAFNQTTLLRSLEFVYRDLIRVQLLEWAFSSVTEFDDEAYNADAEITTLMIERTANFLVKWIRTMQNVSWPEIGIEFAKRAIDHTTSPVPASAYNVTARRVKKAFEEHGAESYYYQVLVVPTSAAGLSLAVGSMRMEDYANITNFNGLDIHVFRFNATNISERSVKARAWMSKNRESILKEIRTGAVHTPSALLSSLQTESSIGPIYSDDLFRSVILLRHVRKSSADDQFPIGYAAARIFKLETTRTSYSVLDHGRETTYSWKAFFFL